MWKLMENGNSRLYYADSDGATELEESGLLELGDRVYVEDVMLYAGNDSKLYGGKELATADDSAAEAV